jgi:hypothetical protein
LPVRASSGKSKAGGGGKGALKADLVAKCKELKIPCFGNKEALSARIALFKIALSNLVVNKKRSRDEEGGGEGEGGVDEVITG